MREHIRTILGVTIHAFHRCVGVLPLDVTLLARHFDMLTGQVETRHCGVIERGRQPALNRMALGAIRSQTGLVRIGLAVTGITIARGILQVNQ